MSAVTTANSERPNVRKETNPPGLTAKQLASEHDVMVLKDSEGLHRFYTWLEPTDFDELSASDKESVISELKK